MRGHAIWPAIWPVASLAMLALSGGLGGCVDHKPGTVGTQSITVGLIDPASPGDISHRLMDTQRTITINLAAYDADFEFDPTFERDVQIFVQFLGTLTPSPDFTNLKPFLGAPLKTIRMIGGKAIGQTVNLPPVFGPTTLWVDDGDDRNGTPTHAAGTSPILWFRDPFISDIQRPADEKRLNALTDSPLEAKQVAVNASRYGAVGRFVVTSVFSQGYTLSDVQCRDAAGTPPCTAQAYDHIMVFSFSAPRDQRGRLLRPGQMIDGFAGGISEFNGLTEVGFPATFASDDTVDLARLPVPVKFDRSTWFRPLSDPQGIINFERNEAAPIEINNAVVCELDDEYATFKQWKLDPSGDGGDCSNKNNVLNVITAGVIGDLDPATLVGKTLPRVVGVVRPVELGTFNVWIIYPRSAADLTLE